MGLTVRTVLYGHRFDGDPMPRDYRAAIERISRDMARIEHVGTPRAKTAHDNLRRLRWVIEGTLRRIEHDRETKAAIRERGKV